MSGKWNPKLHPRDGENGRFTRNWEARLAEQIDAARKAGKFGGYTPSTRGSSSAPYAKQLGYVRVGDHPNRAGAVGGEETYFGVSSHPEAGGIWVDPARPGTQVAPSFRNDFGSPMSQLSPVPSRSEEHKRDRSDRRRYDYTHTPDDRERLPSEHGGKIGRRLEDAPEAAVKEMRRAQRRARTEGHARTPVRRTPRGTQVDDWMNKVNDRIGKGTGRG